MSRVLVILGVLALIVVAIFAYLSFTTPTPRVTQILPSDGSDAVLPTNPITITFSVPMDPVQTQSNIRIEPSVPGVFNWQDEQTLTWTPRARLPLSTTVTIRVVPAALSTQQRSLGTETISRFTTLGATRLTASTPALDARFIYLPDHVTMTFNRPLDGGLLADSMSIDPPLKQQQRAVDGDTITLRGFFEPRTHYQITIPSVVVDQEYGIELDRDYVWSFTTTSQYPHLSILNRDRIFNLDASAPVYIPTQFINVSRLDIALYPLTRRDFETLSAASFDVWSAYAPSIAPRTTKSILTNTQPDQYTQLPVELGALPAGTYYVQIQSPEGVGDAQLLLLE